MRLIEVLPDYEAKRFSRPPVMTSDDRKKYFKIDDSIRASIEKTKQPDNKVGLLVQYGYFKLCGKFFTTKIFKPADIKAASKKLGITASNDFVEKYKDRTRQKHRVKILEVCGYVDFDSAIATFEEAVADMVDKQMHPRKLFYVTFAPRIKDLSSQNLVSFARIKSELEHKEYPITPTYYVNESKITRNWDNILRLIATIKLREHRALTIIKRLGDYSSQHPLQEALKEFGRIIKSIFILKYIDDVEWRQSIEKQLNKGELANKFSATISFVDQNILDSLKEDQEIAVMCKTIIQNIIILWNYIELTKIIMRSDPGEQVSLLERIISASILTWQHVNLHGTYDFSNLLSANNPDYTLDEMINFKAA